jgi:Family of unknown function (DUF6502)
MVGSEQPQRTKISRKRAESLLYPIAAFLHAGGLTKKESLAVLTSAIDEILEGDRGRQMEHIGHPTPYADVVAAWMRRKPYLDSSGCPRILPLSGPNGFTALVQKVSPGTKARTVLSVLMRYRNIRRVQGGRYELVRPFFYANSDKATAFEPIAYFLSDASATLAQILKRKQLARHPERFWLKVESIYLSEAIARKFAAFARERSLLFLEELDDWLEAHRRASTNSVRKRRRVGLGLFSIYSSPENASPKR